VVNPNAPTGTFAPIEEIARLAGKVRGRAIVGVDEAYVNFAKDNAVRLVKQFENVIVLRTLSKGYSLAGLRFGFAIAPEPIIAMLNKVKDSYNLDAVAIAAATAAITDNAYAQATWQKVIDERDRLVPKLCDLGFDVLPSESNFLLATAPKPGAEAISMSARRSRTQSCCRRCRRSSPRASERRGKRRHRRTSRRWPPEWESVVLREWQCPGPHAYSARPRKPRLPSRSTWTARAARRSRRASGSSTTCSRTSAATACST
jgi:histidinol-phosphate/aromatic aminotransferase/cobyric acid decarboxylase-like protein